MAKGISSVIVSFLILVLLAGSSLVMAPGAMTSGNGSSKINASLLPLPQSLYSPSGKQAFAFVSNFEDQQLDGWQSVQGASPQVVTSEKYSGEPSLMSSASSGAQIDFANQGFVLNQHQLSLQVAIHLASNSSGYIGFSNADDSFLALIGVENSTVVAGSNLTSLKTVGAIPKNTAYPPGWAYILADLTETKGKWVMNVFVDETEQVSKQVPVPGAGNYAGALIETTAGTVYYTNVIFSTYQMANLVSGYHPMQGYGGRVASAGIVRLLPAFTNLTAVMTINSFSVPESDILSFQINSQNKTAATQATCVGFFQIGMFLDSSSGYVDPWYVPYGDCIPYSFSQAGTLHIPKGETVILSIVYEAASQQILFKEVYPKIHETLSATISYRGSDFYSAYTQMEFQTSGGYPIGDYKLSGSIFGIQITETSGATEYLPAIYMLPFNLNAPTSWDVHYYENATAGYDELTT